MRDTKTTKQQAAGHWLAILADLAPCLMPAIEKVGTHVPCPLLGGKDGFRLFKDVNQTGGAVSNQHGVFSDGFKLLMWINDWRFTVAHDSVYEWVNGRGYSTMAMQTPRRTAAIKPVVEDVSKKAERKRYLLNKLWGDSVKLSGVDARPAVEYLAKRKCFPLPWEMPDLAFHSSLQYKDDSGSRNYGGLLAVARDKDGRAVTLHRTFLSNDGNKAPVKQPKRAMPVPEDAILRGGAIRLQPRDWTGDVIGIAEGIETALSVSCATGTVCWSSMTATLLAKFEPPKWVKHVIIWADNDVKKSVMKNGYMIDAGEAGQKAALELRERLLKMGVGCTVKISPELPGRKGVSVDWADVYAMHGSKPFLYNDVRAWAI